MIEGREPVVVLRLQFHTRRPAPASTAVRPLPLLVVPQEEAIPPVRAAAAAIAVKTVPLRKSFVLTIHADC